MKPVTEFTKNDYDLIQRDYAELMEWVRKRVTDPVQLEMVNKAFEFANSAHNGVRRRSGEPYMLHPIAVAKIVVREIGLGHKSICAALLHDVVEDTEFTVEDIETHFGHKIAMLVDGLTKIKTVLDNEDNTKGTQSLQAENFRRILLTLNDDARVVLIKLADRLHNCRTIEFMPEYKRDKILSETMYVFIPLAHRLGLYSVKSEMENIWLRFKEPDAYNRITARINENRGNKEKMIESFLVPVRETLDKNGIEYTIRTRVKTPYSIWHKINFKHVTFDEISDMYAVRIIFEPTSGDLMGERNECFRIFSLITAIYEYRPERVRDWVMHPKPNGYEALHLTVITPDRTNIEVQIRSHRMDDIAEKGIAAHWNYKRLQPQTEESQMDKWIARIKTIIANPDVNSLEMLDIIHHDLVESDIIVFDARNRQLSVPKGATALDFAYQQDTDAGNHAIAAKINHKLTTLSTVLRSGDQVEIITSMSEQPHREWLNFLTTRAAVNAVNGFFGIKADGEVQKNNYIIAGCCKPIPGDPVIGFKLEDGRIEVHKKTCSEANSLASKFGDRIVTPKWIVDTYDTFPVRVSMSGVDRMGLMHEISGKISKENKISFKSVNISADNGLFEGYMDIWVHDTETLDSVIRLLGEIEGIQKVSRMDL
ncbi:MAG: bifunctional (p)ppGpp synthetase/guanosine-3',5'-bis(diphosphate) 3'-pyrophosphohydrolase [Bacteroidales bacterium]|nr:bifunctional (p)ppGpp synthetase/guanosine-3',5'-bis(diphosphate) 3'-pyrophosphohydrolase [Candidatus Hennigimonas equi]